MNSPSVETGKNVTSNLRLKDISNWGPHLKAELDNLTPYSVLVVAQDGSLGRAEHNWLLGDLSYEQPFCLISAKANSESYFNRTDGGAESREAKIRLTIRGVEHSTVSEGNGPVSALERAFKKALEEEYPQVLKVKLTDYHVDILDPENGVDAQTRVLLAASNGNETCYTVGVSTDVVRASGMALARSFEHFLLTPDNLQRLVKPVSHRDLSPLSKA